MRKARRVGVARAECDGRSPAPQRVRTGRQPQRPKPAYGLLASLHSGAPALARNPPQRLTFSLMMPTTRAVWFTPLRGTRTDTPQSPGSRGAPARSLRRGPCQDGESHDPGAIYLQSLEGGTPDPAVVDLPNGLRAEGLQSHGVGQRGPATCTTEAAHSRTQSRRPGR